MNKEIEISVVVPLFNEEANVSTLISRLSDSLSSINAETEIICIDDGSKDNTLINLIKLQESNSRLKIIQLSRNFGHQAAYLAGLKESTANYTVMIDGDLQDPPELIPELYNKIKDSDIDIVYGKRTKRKEGLFKKILILLFHKIFSNLTSIKAPANVGNFSILNRSSLDALLTLPEKNIYLPGLRFYIGFKQDFVEYDRGDRDKGDSLSLSRLFKLAFDAIFSFSKIPIKISLIIGIIGILLSLTGSGVVIYKK